jgi:hypothetical protein
MVSVYLSVRLVSSGTGGGSMGSKPARSRKHWTEAEVERLQRLADGCTPTRVIGLKLDRSEDAVRIKASEAGISLKSTRRASADWQ